MKRRISLAESALIALENLRTHKLRSFLTLLAVEFQGVPANYFQVIPNATLARRRDIVWQFLTEAVVLTGSGGIIALLLCYLLVSIVASTVPSLPAYIPVWVLALTMASSVGLFFGIYPAVKAARLDPVVALRYE